MSGKRANRFDGDAWHRNSIRKDSGAPVMNRRKRRLRAALHRAWFRVFASDAASFHFFFGRTFSTNVRRRPK